MKLLCSTIKRISLVSLLALVSSCSSLPAEKQSFNNKVNKAASGDIRAISTVRHVYCTGDWYKLYKTRANSFQCEVWSAAHIKAFSRSSMAAAFSQDISRFRYIQGGKQYLWILEDMVRGDSASAYDSAAIKTIKLVENIDSKLAKANLFAFYNDYSRHDKDHKNRTPLAKELCRSEKTAEYCSYLAWRLYKSSDYQQSIELYETYGTKGSYDKLYLAKMYLYHSGNFTLKKLSKSNELLKYAFDSEYSGLLKKCREKNGESHQKCIKLRAERDRLVLLAQTEYIFLKDESLQRDIRIDRYKLALSKHLKEKNYASALRYFDFFQRLDYTLPNSMLFFKAEALFHTQKLALAEQTYNQYLNVVGKKGSYYKKSLQRLMDIEQITLRQ